jgi:hypothetical protein
MAIAQPSYSQGTSINEMIKERRNQQDKRVSSQSVPEEQIPKETGKGVVIGNDDFFKPEEDSPKEAIKDPETDSSVTTEPPKVDNIFDF